MDTKNWQPVRWYNQSRWELEVVIANDYQPLDAGVTMLRMFAELHTCTAQTQIGFKRWALKFIRDASIEQKTHDALVRLRVDEIAVIRPATEEPFVTEPHPSRPGVTCVQVFNQNERNTSGLCPRLNFRKRKPCGARFKSGQESSPACVRRTS